MSELRDTGSWPTHRCSCLDWLMQESRELRFADDVFAEVGRRLLAEGVPLARTTMHLRVLHPQFGGATMIWRPTEPKTDFRLVTRDVFTDQRFLNSPVRALYEGVDGIRQRLDLPTEPDANEFGVYADLRAEGITDYVAMPMIFTDGRRHACSWATKQPGGFTTGQLVRINDLLPALAMAVEIRMNRRLARSLLDTYVGRFAGTRILEGDIIRGSGTTLRAAIWTCDMRGFTTISENWPRDDVIAMLNEYFDTMAMPVEAHGGEILKFIGDAMLAVFPLAAPEACANALRAAFEAREGMRELNQRRVARDQPEIGYGIALHVGDVMYGNIGAASRLDFTVIGPAVNEAARLESLSKDLRRRVVLSGPFAGLCGCSAEFLTSLGRFRLKGVGGEMEVFGLVDDG